MKENKTLKSNLEILAAINPTLSKWIEEQEDVDWVAEIKSKNGAKNLLITAGSRKENAFDMTDPMKEARKAAKSINLFRENISILVGFGLGYLVQAMLVKAEKGHRVLVIEPVAHMIKLAFSNFNFTKALMNGSLLIVAPGTDEIGLALAVLDASFVINDWALTINKYVNWRMDEYGKLIQHANNTLNQILSNTGTIAGQAGAKIADNDIACMPFVIRHRGVVELKDLYKNKPAILVSTGPSLAKNIHHLIDLKDRAVIIAVGQALRILLAYGINKIDFITTVDFGEVNMTHYRGLMDCDIPLVTINRAYAPLLKAWQGPKFIVGTPVDGQEKTAAGILMKKGFLSAGGSVAHLSFSLAQWLGCNPICFVGQDLSLSSGSHFNQADAMGDITVDETGSIKWDVTDPRCSLHERDDLSMGNAISVEGYFGGTVFTNAGLLSFLHAFTNLIDAHLKEDKSIERRYKDAEQETSRDNKPKDGKKSKTV